MSNKNAISVEKSSLFVSIQSRFGIRLENWWYHSIALHCRCWSPVNAILIKWHHTCRFALVVGVQVSFDFDNLSGDEKNILFMLFSKSNILLPFSSNFKISMLSQAKLTHNNSQNCIEMIEARFLFASNPSKLWLKCSKHSCI